jgi:hypothetical protein
MLRRFEPVTSQRLNKIERHKVYELHLRKVTTMKGCIDSTQPELSPRHRLIAQRAKQRRSDFLKTTRLNVRAITRQSAVSSNDQPSERRSARIEVDPFASPMFPTAAPFVRPADLNFFASYHNNPTFARGGSASSHLIKTRRQSQLSVGTNHSDTDEDILDVNLSSDEVSDSDEILTNISPQ